MASKTIAVLLVSVLVIGAGAGYVLLSSDSGSEPPEKDSINIVTFGASNTNGYGMRGYITEAELELVMSGQASKDDINVYGYQRLPEGAYPDLIRDHYVGVYGEEKVKIDQMAISSMRVEELRIMLDADYNGDDYSTWRFTGTDGWFNAAEEGGISALRAASVQKVTDADLITVDIGWNNFGVYICNQLVDYLNNGNYKWTVDLADIFDTPEEIAAAEEAKGIIREYIVGYVGDTELTDVLTNIFSYSILGFIHNFDIVMERIYALNPDVKVVVIGIQNLLHGVVVDLGGQTFPLGDVFGNFVDMANYYTSACSPYQDRYQYVKAGTDGHVEVFFDHMKTYDGDAENLDQNVKDCYDYYDNSLFLQSTIDYVLAQYLDDNPTIKIPFGSSMTGAEIIKKGKAGQLNNVGQALFDPIYWPALYAGYDTLSTLVKEVATLPSVKADGLLDGTVNISQEEDDLETALMNELLENVQAAATLQDYTVDVDKVLDDDAAKLVASIYVRFYMGNSFFSHPDAVGHTQICDAVIDVRENPEHEKDQAVSSDLAASVVAIKELLGTA